jgi:peptidyl-prolyl cis-trans isomerase D
MLDLMRKHAYSWTIRAIVIALIAVFAFWGVGTGFFTRIKPVATVDGHQILSKDVDHEAEQIRRRLQQVYGAEAAQVLARFNVRQEALDQLIDQQLVLDEAHRLGLKIGDAQLEQAIASQAAFQVGGRFDFQAYQQVLRANGLHPAEYEADTRLQLLQELMRRMVSQSVEISDSEAHQEYDRINLKLALAYVEIPYSAFVPSMTPTQKQVEDYYNQHREQFREPERIQFDFIRYDPDQMGAKFNPSDKEIEDYYKRYRDQNFTHPEQVRARHILIAVPANAAPQQKQAARAKAEDILKQLKAGADFAKLARQYSDDPGSKNNGGELGYFSQGEMVKPFAEAAFRLRPGEMTIAETQFGFHVIEVEDHKLAHVDTLEEARPKIIEGLRHREGAEAAHQAIDQDLAAALDGKGMAQLAEKRGLNVIRTPYLAIDQHTPEIDDPRVMQEAFKLNPNDVRVINGRNASFLVKLIARAPSYIPKLADVQSKVRAALVREMAEAKAQEQAAAFIKQVKAPADFDKVAAELKLQVRTTGDFSRAEGSIPTIGAFSDAVEAAALEPTVPGLVGHPLALDGNAYVFEVQKRAEPDDAQWKQAKDSFIERLRKERQMRAWASFVQNLRARAQITVHPDLIGQPTESSM